MWAEAICWQQSFGKKRCSHWPLQLQTKSLDEQRKLDFSLPSLYSYAHCTIRPPFTAECGQHTRMGDKSSLLKSRVHHYAMVLCSWQQSSCDVLTHCKCQLVSISRPPSPHFVCSELAYTMQVKVTNCEVRSGTQWHHTFVRPVCAQSAHEEFSSKNGS